MAMLAGIEADDAGNGVVVLRLIHVPVDSDQLVQEIYLQEDQAKQLAVELNNIAALRYRKEKEAKRQAEEAAKTMHADDPELA